MSSAPPRRPVAVGLAACTVVRAAGGARAAALHDVTLTCPAGARTILLGANGAGKSTVLRVLAGLDQPSGGQRLLDGVPVAGRHANDAWRDLVGWVGPTPDDQLLAPIVRDDLAFGLINRGLPLATVEARVAAVAQELGIAALLDRGVHDLSLGEQHRVALAGVLVLEPAVLLLDEPTIGLDARGRRALFSLLDRLHRSGTTMVMATHDLGLAEHWADHVVLLGAGRVVAAGRPRDVLADPVRCVSFGLTDPPLWPVPHEGAAE